MYKKAIILVFILLAAMMLAACGGSDEPTETATTGNVEAGNVETAPVAQESSAAPDEDAPPQGPRGGFESAYLQTDHDGAAQPIMQLILGTMQLEETEQAVSTEQAGKLLPLWLALQGDAVTNAAERNAVLKQIESTMSTDQMQAIVDLKLTNQSLGQWAEANGIELPQFGGRGQGGQGGGGEGGPRGDGPLANMSEEERAAFREEMQGLTQEERQARLAEMGIEFTPGQGGRPGGPGGGRIGLLMEPLIEMLTERSTG